MYDLLQRLLFDIDPYDLNYGDNVDEYERTVWEALPDLRAGLSNKEVADVLLRSLEAIFAEPVDVAVKAKLTGSAPLIRRWAASSILPDD